MSTFSSPLIALAMGHSIICKEDKLDEMTWALETTHLIYDGNISIMREQAGHSRHL